MRYPFRTMSSPTDDDPREYVLAQDDGTIVADCGVVSDQDWQKDGESFARIACHSLNALIEALAWYYADVYDGPDCHVPEWVSYSVEALGDYLRPNGDARARWDAAMRLIDETQTDGLIW